MNRRPQARILDAGEAAQRPVDRLTTPLDQGAPAPQAPGLVDIATSGTTLELERRSMRLRRMRRGLLLTADVLQADAPSGYKAAMVTLTYRPGEEYAPRQVSAFLKRLREWARRRNRRLFGVWVLEMQQRGAPHYHVLVWLPKGVTLPKPDKQGWWPHGSTRIEWARRPVGYLSKYATKGSPGLDLPQGARIWGAFGRTADQVVAIRWQRAPRWLLDRCVELGGELRRLVGGWWRVQGEEWRSPWRLRFWTTERVVLLDVGFVETRPVTV